ncbi:MAG TPA: hypothetical protein VI365_35170 [Trebonia sp.]
MVADLEGYFSSSAPDSFVPISPTRELDTRTTGSALERYGGSARGARARHAVR